MIKSKAKRKSLRASLNAACLKSNNGMASYAIRYTKAPDGMHISDVCHARLCWPRTAYNNNPPIKGDVIKEIVLSLSSWYIRIPEHKQAWYKKYVHYIINESPWSRCFITKTWGMALRYGIRMDVNENVSHLMGAAIALREGYEFSNKLELFNSLLDKGHSGHVAYIVSCSITNPEPGVYKGLSLCGHNVLSGCGMTWAEVMSFFRKGYGVKKGIAKDQLQCNYTVYGAIRGTYNSEHPRDDDNTFGAVLQTKAKAIIQNKGWNQVTQINDHGINCLIVELTKELA